MDPLIEFVSDLLEEMAGSRRRWVRWLGFGCIALVLGGIALFVIGVIALVNGLS